MPRSAATDKGDRLRCPIAMVGLMGSGKSSVGLRLANALGAEFVDADDEIKEAAGRTIAEIFEEYGEGEFRALERRVIARLMQATTPKVIATGGGAFMDADTRAVVGPVHDLVLNDLSSWVLPTHAAPHAFKLVVVTIPKLSFPLTPARVIKFSQIPSGTGISPIIQVPPGGSTMN